MIKKIHIIGICGTFMGGVAKLAKELGFEVQGSDQNTYPPMSTQLESLGVTLFNGYNVENITDDIDIVIIGNTISRGNPELEFTLNKKLSYTSGAQWLSENVLNKRWVLAISGTHGKTTTSSLLAWILEYCGYKPGFLIGGVPENFGVSARIGQSDFFVIEADEYDTAFSDKRSKFIHYRPNTLVINNLEFDHADIFDDINAIATQFHHLIKTIPNNGQIIYNAEFAKIEETLDMGYWSPICGFTLSRKNQNKAISPTTDSSFNIEALTPDGSKFCVRHTTSIRDNANDQVKSTSCEAEWNLIGEHNLNNAIAAIAAAHHVGVPIKHACEALSGFKSVKRRLELKGKINNISVYDDFAHHPTAIKSTIQGLKANIGNERLIAVIEPRSNTMKLGTHKQQLKASIEEADMTFFLISDDVSWDADMLKEKNTFLFTDAKSLIDALNSIAETNDHILMMSNGGFADIHNRLLRSLASRTNN